MKVSSWAQPLFEGARVSETNKRVGRLKNDGPMRV